MVRALAGRKGYVDPIEIQGAMEGGDSQRSRTALFILENTHNRSGGSVISPQEMAGMTEAARSKGVPVHLDGARIFNAAAALGVEVAELCAWADSVAFSLNKGLSAPMGAILAGPREFISEALIVRQRLGGGWRPTGILAAAGIVALETMIERLAEDHGRAQELAREITGLPGLDLDPKSVQTNLVVARLRHPRKGIERVIRELAERGVLVLKFGPDLVRLAVHWEIGAGEVRAAAEAFKAVLK
jgi:threonine aldolase